MELGARYARRDRGGAAGSGPVEGGRAAGTDPRKFVGEQVGVLRHEVAELREGFHGEMWDGREGPGIKPPPLPLYLVTGDEEAEVEEKAEGGIDRHS